MEPKTYQDYLAHIRARQETELERSAPATFESKPALAARRPRIGLFWFVPGVEGPRLPFCSHSLQIRFLLAMA